MMKKVSPFLEAIIPWSIPIAWLVFALYVILAGPGCGYIHFPPHPVPTPIPTPTPTPPPPPVPHDPVCQPATNCDCWVQPPGADWSFLTCTAPQTCENHVCKTPPPPEPVCPEQCPTGQQCTDPKVGCVPIPPPPVPGDPCPPIISTAKLILNDKPYGNGFDSSPRLLGDENACFLITHEHGIFNCSFEGWPARAACEMKLMGGCPVWQYQKPGAGPTDPIFQCHDDRAGWASCDHFGDPVNRDDPQTPTTGDTLATLKGFEGTPRECGLQRDALGPNAGFFTIAHGEGQIQACFPNNPAICGPWRPFNF